MFCRKLQKEATPLTRPPIPGPLGERIQKEISKEAWDLWLKQQTILINENRLNALDPEARAFLRNAMEQFFFEGDGVGE